MSCETNANKVGKLGGVAAGISVTAGKFSQATGAMLERAGRATAPLSNAVLNLVDRQGVVARLARDRLIRGIAAGAVMNAIGRASRQARLDSGRKIRPTTRTVDEFMEWLDLGMWGGSEALKAGLAVDAVRASTGAAGTIVSRATHEAEAREVNARKRVMSFLGTPLGETKQKVKLYRSGLTGMLNRADLLGTPYVTGRGVRSNDGVVFETGGMSWHRGTSVVDTPGGERTITHLQSLSLPAAHYYFNQPLDDEQAVNVANQTIRPETLPGYVGMVSRLEALTPGWATAKHALIRSQLFWGKSGGRERQAAPLGLRRRGRRAAAEQARQAPSIPQIGLTGAELRTKMEAVAGDLEDHQ